MALQPLPSGALLDGEAPPLRPLDPTVRLDGELSPDWMTTAAQGRGAGVQGDIGRPLVGARAAIRNTAPALGGAAAFGPGFAMGGTAGAGLGSLGGPGGAAVVGTVGGLLGGIVSAMGGAALVSKAQDAVTQYIPEDIKAIFGQDQATQAADAAAHPIAEFVGGLTPQLLSMRPGFGPAPVVAADASRLTKALASPVTSHAIGGALGGGTEAGSELYNTGTVDPLKVGIATAFGAALNRPTTLGESLIAGTGNATIKGMQIGARAAGKAYRGTQSIGAAAVQAAKNRFGPASEAVIDAQATRPTGTAAGTEPIGSPAAALPAVSLPQQAGTPPPSTPSTVAGVPGALDLSSLDDNFIGAITSAIYDSKMVAENGDTRAMLTPYEMATLRSLGVGVSSNGTISAADVQRLMDERAARQDKKFNVTPLPHGVPLDGEPPNPAGELGDGEKYVSTPAGNYVRTRFEVVPAASLTAATGDLQNRDRSRDSTDLQVQNIVSQFDPTRLGDSAETDRGAPIVGPDGVIESGNGRVLALNKIHSEYPPQRQAYIDHIESLGYSTAGIENPILIRRRMNDMTPEQRRQFVIESNKDAKLAMTSVEQARSDADNLDDDLLAKFKGGDIDAAGNSEFVRGFMGKLTTGESAALNGEDGTISVDGIRRISNAMMARAYEDPHLLSKMIEARDNNIKSIGGALLDNSGAWSGLRAAIKAGDVKPEYDVTAQLVEAARKVSDARAAGQHINDVLSQNDAFNPMDPIVEGFIRAFYNSTMRNAAGRDAISSVLQRYVQLASEQTTAPSLFGDSEATTPALLLTRALTERNEAKNGGLFNQAAEDRAPVKGPANEGNDASGAPQGNEGGDAGRAGQGQEVALDGQRNDGSVRRGRRANAGKGRARTTAAPRDTQADQIAADYAEAFSDASFTNRTSVYNSAAEALGLTPDEFALLPGPRQVALLSRLISDTFGVPVTVEGGLQDRFAIDQMLDAYQNVQGMASVLGISNRAISLGGKLSIHLEKTGRSYLGAFAPGKNKILLPGRTNSFAHEWGHALDWHVLNELTDEQARGITGLIRKEGADFEPVNVKQAFVDLLNAMYFDKAALAAHVMDLERQIATTKSASVKAKAQAQIDRIKAGSGQTSKARSNFWLGAKSFDGPGGDYWTSPTEMFARAFEAFVSYRAALADLGTEFIGKGDANYLAGAEERFVKTFPKGAERELIFQKFGVLFDMLTKEDLLSGPAAERPLPAQDGLPPEPREAGWLQRAVDNEVGAWADRRRQREKTEGRAKNPRTLGQKAQDVAGFFGFGMTAEMKMLARRYGSATAMRLHDMLEFTTGDGTRTQTRGFIQAVRLLEHQLGNRLHKAWEDYAPREGASKRPRELDKAETQQLRDLLISENVPDASPQMKAMAAAIRKIMDDTFYLLHNVGVKVGYTRNGYLPRLVDMGRVLADEGGFIERAAEVYELMLTRAAEAEHAKAVKAAEEAGEDPPEYEEQDFAADAEEMAHKWLHALKSAAPEEFDAKSPAADFTKSRTMPVEADKIMEDFYVNDPMEAVGNYLRMAARRIEFARRFGPKGEVLTQMYKKMSAEGVDGADLETIQTITNIVVGHGATQIKHPTIRSVSSALRFLYGTAALLPRATFSSLHEGLTAGVVMGNPKYGLKTLKAQIEQLLGTATAKERRDIAMICGMIQAGTGSQILAERMGGEFADDTVWGKLSDRMYYNIGLTAYTRHQQTAMIAPAHAFLYVLGRDIARGLAAGEMSGSVKRDYDDAIARYNELGITDPHAFAARILELGGTPKLADVEGGVEGAKKDPYAFDWITAINRLSRQVIQEPSAMSRPRAASSPVGQFVYGIMSFNYEQWRNVWKGEFMRARQRAERSGKGFTAEKLAFGLVPAFAAVLLGSIGVTIVREYLTNQQRFQKAKEDGDLLPNMAKLGASRAVGTPFDPILQAFTGMKYNRDPALALLGPTLGSMGQAVKDIMAEFTQDGKSNTSEHNAIRGAYRLVSPWAVAGLATLPGGPAVSALYGVASAAITAPQAGETAGDIAVGPKKKRKKPKRPQD